MSEPTLHQGLEGLAAREAAPYFCPDLEGHQLTAPDPADPPDDDGEEPAEAPTAWCLVCAGLCTTVDGGDFTCFTCGVIPPLALPADGSQVLAAAEHLLVHDVELDDPVGALLHLIETPEDLARWLAILVGSDGAAAHCAKHVDLGAELQDIAKALLDQQGEARTNAANRILDLQSSMMAACDAGGVPIHVATEQGGIEYLSLEQRMVMLGELAARANQPEKTPAGAAPPAEPAEAEAPDPGPVLTWEHCKYEVRSEVDPERIYVLTGEQLHAGGRPTGVTVQTVTTLEHPDLGVVSLAGLQAPTGLRGTFRADRERPESVPTIIAAARAVGEMAARRTRLWECANAEGGVAAFRATWASAEAFEADAQAAIQRARAAARAGVAHG